MPTLNPITQIALQTSDGWYSLDWDGTASLVVFEGSGAGHATHNGISYDLVAANPAATVAQPDPLSQDAPYNPDAPYSPTPFPTGTATPI